MRVAIDEAVSSQKNGFYTVFEKELLLFELFSERYVIIYFGDYDAVHFRKVGDA